MIKHETIHVSGTVLYCDACQTRGPEVAYDNVDDCLDQAEQLWLDAGRRRQGVLCGKGCSSGLKKTRKAR